MKSRSYLKTKLNPPKITKELKSFLGAIQYMAKFVPKLSERMVGLQKLLGRNWGPEQEEDFG